MQKTKEGRNYDMFIPSKNVSKDNDSGVNLPLEERKKAQKQYSKTTSHISLVNSTEHTLKLPVSNASALHLPIPTLISINSPPPQEKLRTTAQITIQKQLNEQQRREKEISQMDIADRAKMYKDNNAELINILNKLSHDEIIKSRIHDALSIECDKVKRVEHQVGLQKDGDLMYIEQIEDKLLSLERVVDFQEIEIRSYFTVKKREKVLSLKNETKIFELREEIDMSNKKMTTLQKLIQHAFNSELLLNGQVNQIEDFKKTQKLTEDEKYQKSAQELKGLDTEIIEFQDNLKEKEKEKELTVKKAERLKEKIQKLKEQEKNLNKIGNNLEKSAQNIENKFKRLQNKFGCETSEEIKNKCDQGLLQNQSLRTKYSEQLNGVLRQHLKLQKLKKDLVDIRGEHGNKWYTAGGKQVPVLDDIQSNCDLKMQKMKDRMKLEQKKVENRISTARNAVEAIKHLILKFQDYDKRQILGFALDVESLAKMDDLSCEQGLNDVSQIFMYLQKKISGMCMLMLQKVTHNSKKQTIENMNEIEVDLDFLHERNLMECYKFLKENIDNQVVNNNKRRAGNSLDLIGKSTISAKGRDLPDLNAEGHGIDDNIRDSFMVLNKLNPHPAKAMSKKSKKDVMLGYMKVQKEPAKIERKREEENKKEEIIQVKSKTNVQNFGPEAWKSPYTQPKATKKKINMLEIETSKKPGAPIQDENHDFIQTKRRQLKESKEFQKKFQKKIKNTGKPNKEKNQKKPEFTQEEILKKKQAIREKSIKASLENRPIFQIKTHHPPQRPRIQQRTSVLALPGVGAPFKTEKKDIQDKKVKKEKSGYVNSPGGLNVKAPADNVLQKKVEGALTSLEKMRKSYRENQTLFKEKEKEKERDKITQLPTYLNMILSMKRGGAVDAPYDLSLQTFHEYDQGFHNKKDLARRILNLKSIQKLDSPYDHRDNALKEWFTKLSKKEKEKKPAYGFTTKLNIKSLARIQAHSNISKKFFNKMPESLMQQKVLKSQKMKKTINLAAIKDKNFGSHTHHHFHTSRNASQTLGISQSESGIRRPQRLHSDYASLSSMRPVVRKASQIMGTPVSAERIKKHVNAIRSIYAAFSCFVKSWYEEEKEKLTFNDERDKEKDKERENDKNQT